MKLINWAILLIVAFLWQGCSVNKAIQQTEVQEITFGYGGGITQDVTSYVIKSNGIVLQKDKIIRKIPKDELAEIYEDAANLGNSFNYPQNTFSFIKVSKTNGESYYCWGDVTAIPIITLFAKLNSYTK